MFVARAILCIGTVQFPSSSFVSKDRSVHCYYILTVTAARAPDYVLITSNAVGFHGRLGAVFHQNEYAGMCGTSLDRLRVPRKLLDR